MDENELREQWSEAGEPFDPTVADSKKEAVFIRRHMLGDTVIIGNQSNDEWITTEDMGPLSLERCR